MARPSAHLDEKLLAAARELLPQTGCHQLSLRQVAAHAGVNPGMFHYHFKTKDKFLETLIRRTYDEILARLDTSTHQEDDPLTNLRNALNTLGRWVRDHRLLLMRLAADAMAGEQVVVQAFLQNQPRIFGNMGARVLAAQKAGLLPEMIFPQIVGFFAGTIVMPMLMGALMDRFQLVPAPMLQGLEAGVFSDEAIAQRIDMALAGLRSRVPMPPPPTPGEPPV